MTEDQVRDALRDCYDTANPYGQPVNIVEFGLVEAISLDLDLEAPGTGIAGVPPKYKVSLTLLAGTADEDARTLLSAQIGNRLAGLRQISTTRICFVDTPAWTPSRITPAGRHLLKLDQAFPILNNRTRVG